MTFWTNQTTGPVHEQPIRGLVSAVMILSLQDQVNLDHFKTFYWGPTFISSDIDNEIMQGRVSANVILSVKLANKVQGDFLLTVSVTFVVCEKMLFCNLLCTAVVTG